MWGMCRRRSICYIPRVTLAIPDFRSTRVVVAGDVMLDRYWFGATGRISPEAPVPVVHIAETDERPGGAANVAVNLAALGTRTDLLGIVGKDPAGATLERVLKERRIHCALQRVADRPTITKTRVQSRGQQLIRLDRERAAALTDGRLPAALRQRLSHGVGALILSDYGKGALSDASRMIADARDAGVPVLVDPKGTDFSKYRGASLLTPNQSEFEAVAGVAASDRELVANGGRLLADLDLEALLITRGEHGMLLLERAAPPLFLSTQAREVYDVTGAGDTVIATLAAALAAGQTLASAAALANLAAGLVVRKIGVASLTPKELSAAVHRYGQGGRGRVAPRELVSLLAERRAHGERIVMTNGCFDILHAGHVAYLEDARRLGDRLIVAVNDDASVARLKGTDRPVNALEDRMRVLAGLAAVDWVVPFSEDTPARLIADVLPDILVKGGDYEPKDIAGGRDVIANGGEVRVLPFRDGQSTSRIIDRLRGSAP